MDGRCLGKNEQLSPGPREHEGGQVRGRCAASQQWKVCTGMSRPGPLLFTEGQELQ